MEERGMSFTTLSRLIRCYDQEGTRISPFVVGMKSPIFPVSLYLLEESTAPMCRRPAINLKCAELGEFKNAVHKENFSCCEVCFPVDPRDRPMACKHVCGQCFAGHFCAKRCVLIRGHIEDHACETHSERLRGRKRGRSPSLAPSFALSDAESTEELELVSDGVELGVSASMEVPENPVPTDL